MQSVFSPKSGSAVQVIRDWFFLSTLFFHLDNSDAQQIPVLMLIFNFPAEVHYCFFFLHHHGGKVISSVAALISLQNLFYEMNTTSVSSVFPNGTCSF